MIKYQKSRRKRGLLGHGGGRRGGEFTEKRVRGTGDQPITSETSLEDIKTSTEEPPPIELSGKGADFSDVSMADDTSLIQKKGKRDLQSATDIALKRAEEIVSEEVSGETTEEEDKQVNPIKINDPEAAVSALEEAQNLDSGSSSEYEYLIDQQDNLEEKPDLPQTEHGKTYSELAREEEARLINQERNAIEQDFIFRNKNEYLGAIEGEINNKDAEIFIKYMVDEAERIKQDITEMKIKEKETMIINGIVMAIQGFRQSTDLSTKSKICNQFERYSLDIISTMRELNQDFIHNNLINFYDALVEYKEKELAGLPPLPPEVIENEFPLEASTSETSSTVSPKEALIEKSILEKIQALGSKDDIEYLNKISIEINNINQKKGRKNNRAIKGLAKKIKKKKGLDPIFKDLLLDNLYDIAETQFNQMARDNVYELITELARKKHGKKKKQDLTEEDVSETIERRVRKRKKMRKMKLGREAQIELLNEIDIIGFYNQELERLQKRDEGKGLETMEEILNGKELNGTERRGIKKITGLLEQVAEDMVLSRTKKKRSKEKVRSKIYKYAKSIWRKMDNNLRDEILTNYDGIVEEKTIEYNIKSSEVERKKNERKVNRWTSFRFITGAAGDKKIAEYNQKITELDAKIKNWKNQLRNR